MQNVRPKYVNASKWVGLASGLAVKTGFKITASSTSQAVQVTHHRSNISGFSKQGQEAFKWIKIHLMKQTRVTVTQRGGVLTEVLYEEAPPQGPTTYPLYVPF